jgi:hypothetical protein
MSESQIERATVAALLARLNTLSISGNPEDREEAVAIRREINMRLHWGN